MTLPLRRCVKSRIVTLLVALSLGFFLGVFYVTQSLPFNRKMSSQDSVPNADSQDEEGESREEPEFPLAPVEHKATTQEPNRTAPKLHPLADLPEIPINYDVSIFYYAWYGNPKMNNHYVHWNHKRLPHWIKSTAARFSQKAHVPPDDIGSNYYPQLGLYSSMDTGIIHQHMRMIRSTGIGVVILSWYPKGKTDGQKTGIVDNTVIRILEIAHKYKLKVALHIEPYEGRTDETVRKDIFFIHSHYATYPGYYKRRRNPRIPTRNVKPLPVIFIYDSYQILPRRWNTLLGSGGQETSIRGTNTDVFAVGLYLNRGDCAELDKGGFDAAYTYFASERVSHGSVSGNWPAINESCAERSILFMPSIGPGYIDTSVRPWNTDSTQSRRRGGYFRRQFWHAMRARPGAWSVTSFNEWHEGTQIEPAVPKKTKAFKYSNYLPNGPDFYLRLTRRFVLNYTHMRRFHNVTVPADNR